MQVLLPNSSFFAKMLGATLLALTMSFAAGAMNQGQDQSQGKNLKPIKKGECATAPASKSCPSQLSSQAQVQAPSKVVQAPAKTSQAQALPKSFGQTGAQGFGFQCDDEDDDDCSDDCDDDDDQDQKSQSQGQYNQQKFKSTQNVPSLGNTSFGPSAPTTSTATTTACPTLSTCNSYVAASAFGANIAPQALTTIATAGKPFASVVGPKKVAVGWHVKGEKIYGKTGYDSWNESQWTDVRAENINWQNIDAWAANLQNVYVSGLIKHFNFFKATISNSTFAGKFADFDFRGTKLSNVVFTGKFMSSKSGKYSNFDRATLDGVAFVNGDMKKATFKGTKFKNVTFPCTQVHGSVSFENADFWDERQQKWVKLSGEHLSAMGAILSDGHRKALNKEAYYRETNH
ncbi:MAG TPA: pentapeptide repeat-containing protein [Myxococcota bacterium]|nr:pentapeptide repeat-containing protein [Myxococcota bacterium]